jgi:hypothetical protein
MAVHHRALVRLTRHSKTLIRLSCMGIESFWVLKFLSDQAGISAHWSRNTWPDYLSMQSHEMLRFWMLIKSCIPPSLCPTKCLCCEMLQSSSPTIDALLKQLIVYQSIMSCPMMQSLTFVLVFGKPPVLGYIINGVCQSEWISMTLGDSYMLSVGGGVMTHLLC